ncbi:hypothetical protein F5141DRAFT_635780 [Pisolithus sp. B1]|nr:hypothetical protein F5141DRAFT_635780 [Pisolithus sp. B1]
MFSLGALSCRSLCTTRKLGYFWPIRRYFRRGDSNSPFTSFLAFIRTATSFCIHALPLFGPSIHSYGVIALPRTQSRPNQVAHLTLILARLLSAASLVCGMASAWSPCVRFMNAGRLLILFCLVPPFLVEMSLRTYVISPAR